MHRTRLSGNLSTKFSTSKWHQQASQHSSDCKHQDIQLITSDFFFFQFIHLYLLTPREHIIHVDISIYLFFFKKRGQNGSSAPGSKSLHDVGVRRDSEKEVLEMHHILLLLQSH